MDVIKEEPKTAAWRQTYEENKVEILIGAAIIGMIGYVWWTSGDLKQKVKKVKAKVSELSTSNSK